MKLILAILLIGFLGQSQVLLTESTRKIEIDGVPSFFFKVSPDGDFLSFTLPSRLDNPSLGGENHVLKTTDESSFKVPGQWDPVFVGGSGLMVLPIHNGTRYGFFGLEELSKNERETEAIFKDADFFGLYQSAAVLEENDQFVFFRMIAESTVHSMRDYQFDKVTRQVQPVTEIKKLCTETKIKLPMLSKNGREVAGLKVDTQTSAIFKINDDGSCEEVLDLGIKTGKINFDYEGKSLTYHKFDRAHDLDDGFIPTPDSEYVGDIFVFDRAAKTETRLTLNREDNSLYPDFVRSGDVVFLNHPHTEQRKVSFQFIKP